MNVAVTGSQGEFEHRLRGEFGMQRIRVRLAMYSQSYLDALAKRIGDERRELKSLGVDIFAFGPDGVSNTVRVDYFAEDRQAAEVLLRERFGPAIELTRAGASRLKEVPHPFGSWSAVDRWLIVHYGLDRNGQLPRGCRAEEHPDCVVVYLTILQPQGIVTLIGGSTCHEATLQLTRPVGTREVIDASTREPRPQFGQRGKTPLRS